MTNINITDEELKEIEAIAELAGGCTNYLLGSLINPDTEEKIKLEEDAQKEIYKIVLGRTMEYIEENDFPDSEDSFEKYVSDIFTYVQNNLK